jgi:hypothetical protein
MKRFQTLAAAGAILVTGSAAALAAPPAAPPWVTHYHAITPPAPPAQSPAPLFSLFGIPVSAQAPVKPPYCSCVFGTFPGQYGSDRSFPSGPPTQQAE